MAINFKKSIQYTIKNLAKLLNIYVFNAKEFLTNNKKKNS